MARFSDAPGQNFFLMPNMSFPVEPAVTSFSQNFPGVNFDWSFSVPRDVESKKLKIIPPPSTKMRGNEFMDQIILNEVEAFEKRKDLALRAVEDYVRTVIDQVRHRRTYNIQNRFEEKLLQDSCKTLDRLILGLASMSPAPDSSQSIADVSRPMLTSNTVAVNAPTNAWSSGDCSSKTEPERTADPPSPDIVENLPEPMVEPSSSSSSCSTSSSSDASFKQRIRSIINRHPQRSTANDEFAMEIPGPAKALNVDAPEFKPLDNAASKEKSSGAQPQLENYIVPKQNGLSPKEAGKRLAPMEEASSMFDSSSLSTTTVVNIPTVVTGASSVESYSTPPATDPSSLDNQTDEDRKSPTNAPDSVTQVRSPNSFVGACNNIDKLSCNGYPIEAESRPSSHHTKGTNYDAEPILRGTAQELRKHEKQAELEGTPSNDTETSTSNKLKLQPDDETINETQARWSSKEVPGKVPRDVRKTRIPPLWSYVHVVFSEVDQATKKVYAQILADEPLITGLCEEINARPATELKWQDINVDLLVNAPEGVGPRYRAKVISKPSVDEIEVFFIDYGNTAKVGLKDLSPLDMKSKLQYRYCKFAIRCQLDAALDRPDVLDGLPEKAYALFGDPIVIDGETVYPIMDVMASGPQQNIREPPSDVPFKALDDCGTCTYSVVVSHAESPSFMWLVEAKDQTIPEQIKKILEELPPEPCSERSISKGVYVVYKDQRAMITDHRNDVIDLLLLDSGKLAKNVPIAACRRLPLMGHMLPRAAKQTRLANCSVPDISPEIEESVMASVIGKTFDMRVKSDTDSEEVILIDPNTRKYLCKELSTKFAQFRDQSGSSNGKTLNKGNI